MFYSFFIKSLGFLAIFSISFSLEGKESFTFIKWEAGEKVIEKGRFSLLTWNICALPHKFPSSYGGVRSAKDRVNEIAAFIIKSNADIVCLQEAHDVKFSETLVEKLENTYPYFVVNIGGKGSLIPFRFNSGLFIASKFPIGNFSFTVFNDKGRQKAIKKGFFAFQIFSKDQPIAYVINTHLQPYYTPKDAAIRLNQLQTIYNRLLQDKNSAMTYPHIICGDLNIDRFSSKEKEESLALIQDVFFDALLKDANPPPSTCTNYLTYYTNTKNPVPPEEFFNLSMKESIDFCLVLKDDQSSIIQTQIIEAYDESKPKEAISDHHAIITEFNVPGDTVIKKGIN